LVVLKPSGEQYQDVTLASVRAEQSIVAPPTVTAEAPLPTPTPAPSKPAPLGSILGGLGGLIVLAVLGGLGWGEFNKPSLIGSLDSGGMLPPFPLSGRRPVYIGSDVHCKFTIPGDDILPRHAELRPIGTRSNPHVEIRSLDSSKLVKVDKLETVFQTLHDGNIIKIGSFEFSYSCPPGPGIFETENTMETPSPTNQDEDNTWKF
jgi:hypothetical protein